MPSRAKSCWRLRRHLEAVAAQRRALPDGPAIGTEYRFIGPNGGEMG